MMLSREIAALTRDALERARTAAAAAEEAWWSLYQVNGRVTDAELISRTGPAAVRFLELKHMLSNLAEELSSIENCAREAAERTPTAAELADLKAVGGVQ